MKQFKSFGLVVITLLFSATMAFAAKPNIHILATGGTDRKSTRLNSSHIEESRMPSSA